MIYSNFNSIFISSIDTDANGNNDADSDVDDDDDENGGKEPNSSRNGEGAYNIEAGASTSNDPQPGTSSGIRNGDNLIENAEAEASENLQFAWESLEMAAKIFRRLGEKNTSSNCFKIQKLIK